MVITKAYISWNEKKHKKRMEINMIENQKWNMILRMPWLIYHNPEIDWKIRKVMIIRCLKEYRKQ